VRQRLVVIRDGLGIECCNAERAGDLQHGLALRKLPQPAEESLRLPAREDELTAMFDPQRRPREDR
jgi:hypothetical protein